MASKLMLCSIPRPHTTNVRVGEFAFVIGNGRPL